MPSKLFVEALFEAGQTLLIAIAAGLYVNKASGQSVIYQMGFSFFLLFLLVMCTTVIKYLHQSFEHESEDEGEEFLQFGM